MSGSCPRPLQQNGELIGALRRAGAGAANEAFSIANSFRLEAPEKISMGNRDLRGTHTLA